VVFDFKGADALTFWLASLIVDQSITNHWR
jgi:hypothetical protein